MPRSRRIFLTKLLFRDSFLASVEEQGLTTPKNLNFTW
jgi:hypothetical protein